MFTTSDISRAIIARSLSQLVSVNLWVSSTVDQCTCSLFMSGYEIINNWTGMEQQEERRQCLCFIW